MIRRPVRLCAVRHLSAGRCLRYFESEQPALVRTICEFVEIESPSDNKPAADRMGRFLAERFEAFGGRPRFHPATDFGNNLQIDILGTNTSVTATNWFSSSSNQLQEITAGGLKIDSQVSQLVQAMATYSADNSGFDPTASSIHTVPNDGGLQPAMAAAWHA